MYEEFYDNFPCVLKTALKSGVVAFSKGCHKDFEKFVAYRKIDRNNGEDLTLTGQDFLSQMELLKNGKNIRPKPDENKLSSYSCSLNRDIAVLKTIFKLPKPNKHIISGLVVQEKGISEINSVTLHVNWWLYEGCSVAEGFEVIKFE